MNTDRPIDTGITHNFKYTRYGEIEITLDKSEDKKVTLCAEEVYDLFVNWLSKVDRGIIPPGERKAILKLLSQDFS